MRNPIMLVSMACIMLSGKMNAQVVMSFMTGVSPQQVPVPHHIFVNRSSLQDEFRFDLSQVKASYFVGLGAKYDFQPFFVSAEAQYNKREYVYNVTYTYDGFGRSTETAEYAETMNVVHLPVSLGVDLGIVDVISGFLPQVIVSQKTGLDKIPGYHQDLRTLRFGWHTGLAAKVSNVRIGLDWQMDFNNYADHAYIHDQSLTLEGRSSRLLGTLSYQF